jgi:hypothetical protein
MMEDQNLTKLRQNLRLYGKKQWLLIYESLLGVPASSIPRLYRAANLYGDAILFDAIVESSWRELTGDPLNYVLKVASEKWKEQQAEIDGDDDYKSSIEQAKKASLEKNQALEKKLKKGKK